MKIKIKNLSLILFISIVCSSCIGTLIDFYQGYKYMVEFEPYTTTYEVIKLYGLLKDNKIDRLGIKKDDIEGVKDIIFDLYGIGFINAKKIYVADNLDDEYYIKFYNDFKVYFNSNKIVIPRDEIKFKKDYYLFYKDNFSNEVDTIILDIGEIEIIDKYGKTIKNREKIPLLVFKKVKYIERILDWQGNNIIYYKGWLEDYQKEQGKLKIEY